MKTSRVVAYVCVIVLLITNISKAQTPPASGTEQISATVFFGQPFEEFYPNLFDLQHEKLLRFEGAIFNESPEDQQVDFWFDWLDPNNGPRTGPVIMISLGPGEAAFFGDEAPITNPDPPLELILPFCPEQVSVHFSVAGGSESGGPIVVDGVFTHICLIPEPSTFALAGMSLIGLLGSARRRA